MYSFAHKHMVLALALALAFAQIPASMCLIKYYIKRRRIRRKKVTMGKCDNEKNGV